MTSQKATLESKRTFSWFVSYRRLSPQCQFSLSPAALDMYLYGPCWLLKLRWMGIKEYKWKGFFLGCLVGLVMPVQEIFCFAWAALVNLIKIFLFSPVHYFNSFVPIAQQAGQAVVPGRLSLSMCLWSSQWTTSQGDWDFTGLKETVALYDFFAQIYI